MMDCTTKPTHVRIYREDHDDLPWYVDGADNKGEYTELLLQYETFEEALKYVGHFVEETELDGITWEWDTDRKTMIRNYGLCDIHKDLHTFGTSPEPCVGWRNGS